MLLCSVFFPYSLSTSLISIFIAFLFNSMKNGLMAEAWDWESETELQFGSSMESGLMWHLEQAV